MKKRNASFLFLFAVILFLVTSCVPDLFGTSGKGNIVTESRTATDFQSIQLLTSANVTIVKDTLFAVEVEDYENIVNYISAKVVGHVLIIGLDPTSKIILNSQAKILILMPDSLIGLTTAGSGSIDVNSSFKDLSTIKITGSGNVNINSIVKLKTLTTDILGNGNITAEGSLAKLNATTLGSGNLNLQNLATQKAQCTITGSGNMYLNVSDSLKATISGSGNIQYTGAAVVIQNITGSGAVNKIN